MPAAPAAAAVISGTGGSDVLVGTPTADTILGYAGNDTLKGKGGADQIYGGRGADQLFPGTDATKNVLRGAPGSDAPGGDLTAATLRVLPSSGGWDLRSAFRPGGLTWGGVA